MVQLHSSSLKGSPSWKLTLTELQLSARLRYSLEKSKQRLRSVPLFFFIHSRFLTSFIATSFAGFGEENPMLLLLLHTSCCSSRAEDSGLLTHKENLPVRSLVLGDVQRPGSEAAYLVGPLRCNGDSEFMTRTTVLSKEVDLGCDSFSLLSVTRTLKSIVFHDFFLH